MRSIFRYFIGSIVKCFPETRLWRLKRILYGMCSVNSSDGVRILSSVRFQLGGVVYIGERSWLGTDLLVIGGAAPVTFGKCVDIGPRVTIVTGTHEIDTSGDRAAGASYSLPVVIEDGVWIGAACTVLGGVRIGKNAVVAAGSVVTKDIPPFALAAGVPARVIRVLQ